VKAKLLDFIDSEVSERSRSVSFSEYLQATQTLRNGSHNAA
jgi:hypothetical protein